MECPHKPGVFVQPLIGDFITHGSAAFAFAKAAELVIELMNELVESAIDRLIEVIAIAAGRHGWQTSQTGFDSTAFVTIAALVAVLIRKMQFDSLQLGRKAAQSLGDGRFNVASQILAGVNVVVSRDVNEHEEVPFLETVLLCLADVARTCRLLLAKPCWQNMDPKSSALANVNAMEQWDRHVAHDN